MVPICWLKSTTPSTTKRFPEFTQLRVVLRSSQILTIFEKVEVYCQTFFMKAVSRAIGLLFTYLTMYSRITVRVSEGKFITILVGVLDEQSNQAGEVSLLVPQCHCVNPLTKWERVLSLS